MVAVTLRAVSHLALGNALFARLSAAIQGVLVLALVSTLVLLPGISSNVSGSWLATNTSSRLFIPPLWFLGLYETAAGDIVVNAQDIGLDPRAPALARLTATNEKATDAYRGFGPVFRELANIAVGATALVALVGIPACIWSIQRPPPRSPARRRRVATAVLKGVVRILFRYPVAEVGFFFTLQTLARSPAHRIVVAATAGVGLAGAIVTLGGSDIRQTIAEQMPLTVILAAQFVLVSVLVFGFRHAVRIPAELGANWIFQLAWSGDERSYMSGVKKAAVLGLVVPALMTLLPLNVLAMGWRVSLLHGLAGLMAGLIVLDVLLLNFRRAAFACSYLPGVGVKTPLALAGFACVTYVFASLERLALASSRGTTSLFVGLVACLAIARSVDLWKRRRRIAIVFNDVPDPATQRFELNG